MKKAICILSVLFIFLLGYSQQENNTLIRVEIGPCLHFNSLNEDNYLNYMNRSYLVENTSMAGLNLKFIMNIQPKMDIVFGAIAEVGLDDYGSSGFNPGSTNSIDYVLNGGGVYVGLNPHVGGKHIGMDAEICGGFLAYKEYRALFNNTDQPYVSVYDKKSSFLGGIASLGFYLRGKNIGISPEAQLIMAGGNNGSFLFYGFNVPLTVSF